jgi:hypothetical protein
VPDNPSYIHKLGAILEEARSPKPIPFFRRLDMEALWPQEASGRKSHAPDRGGSCQPGARRSATRPGAVARRNDHKPPRFAWSGTGTTASSSGSSNSKPKLPPALSELRCRTERLRWIFPRACRSSPVCSAFPSIPSSNSWSDSSCWPACWRPNLSC